MSAVCRMKMYVASEFRQMAARLVYLKTVFLPVHEEADELKKRAYR